MLLYGGRSRRFEWSLNQEQLVIRNENGLTHVYLIVEVYQLLKQLDAEFGRDWIPLANNVEKMYRSTEQDGLGSFIYRQSKDTFHAQGASYLGVVLEELGIFEWNGKTRGICWRLTRVPHSKVDLHEAFRRFRRR